MTSNVIPFKNIGSFIEVILVHISPNGGDLSFQYHPETKTWAGTITINGLVIKKTSDTFNTCVLALYRSIKQRLNNGLS